MGDEKVNHETWSCFAKSYDPLKIGSIDGTDTEPHDKGIIRSLNSEYKPNKHAKGKPGCTIFVSRLSPKTTKDTIKDIFSKYGRLKRFRLVKDIVTGFPKGYAFIEYESESAAEEAYRKAYKMNIDGHTIFVDFECERLLKGWKPRRLGGGFGGRKESGQLRFGCRDRPFRKPISLEIKEHEERLKRDKELRIAREDRRRQDRDYDRKRSPEGTSSKRKRSRSTDRDRKRSRSKERRTNTTEKKLDDHHSLRASKSETNSERSSKEKIKKSSEGVNKKKRSRSGDRSRRSSRSKDKRTNTEKKSEANNENRQKKTRKLEDQATNDKIDVACKEDLELELKHNEQSNESKLENTSSS